MAGVTYLGERRRPSDGRPTERYSDFTRDHEIIARIQTVSRRCLAMVSLVRTSFENGGRRQAKAGDGCNHRTWSCRGASSHGEEGVCLWCLYGVHGFLPSFTAVLVFPGPLACVQQVEEEYPSLLLMSPSSSSLQHIYEL